MSLSKELLAPKEPTAQEVRSLVDEWIENGGVVRQCKPGVALNFRSQLGDVTAAPAHKRTMGKGKKSKSKKK